MLSIPETKALLAYQIGYTHRDLRNVGEPQSSCKLLPYAPRFSLIPLSHLPIFIMTESNRNSLMLVGDAVRRSMTRNSHYSHASTHSWVISNQQNPPPPPPDEPLPSPVRTSRPLADPVPSPGRTPRPLPDPQHHHQLRTTNADPSPDDEEEYMNIDPNLPGIETGYLNEGLGRGRPPIANSPTAAEASLGRERGFVGGFVSGLRRLPRVVLKYRNVGDKRKYFRRATYGSGGTLTNGTITNGTETVNTLPLYASDPPTPVAGPSTTRYVEALEMPVPHHAETPAPNILGPSLSQRRHHPSFRVSPPSEEAAEQEHTTEFSVDHAQLSPPLPGAPGRISNAVTIYNLPDQEEYRVEESALPLPAPTPNRLSNSQGQNPRSPVASTPAEVQSQSPVRAHPPPTSDYRRMTLSSSPHSPRMTSTSLSSEPSFSSQLSPMRSFFVKLYRLPWIAPERVTEDYRPGGRERRQRVGSGIKKPMTSWYRGKPGVVLSVRNASGELDLLSSNNSSRRASTGTSSTPLSSPALRVRHRSADHQRTHHRESRRRTRVGDNGSRSRGRSHHPRNTVVSANDIQPQTNSPLIPAVYPYPYPFPIPYPTFPTPPPPPQHAQSQSTPRGPRPHRTHGYLSYQPQPPPPVFVMHSPAQSASSVEGSHAPTQVMSPVFVPMSLMPGFLPQETTQQVVPPPPAASSLVSPGEAVGGT
ncbi:hypothetical protein C0995_013289 [Termitomyces sp. Mi166|nr:hypothetical protein C0995_013289 [Termitomyces sp. Mi166\